MYPKDEKLTIQNSPLKLTPDEIRKHSSFEKISDDDAEILSEYAYG